MFLVQARLMVIRLRRQAYNKCVNGEPRYESVLPCCWAVMTRRPQPLCRQGMIFNDTGAEATVPFRIRDTRSCIMRPWLYEEATVRIRNQTIRAKQAVVR